MSCEKHGAPPICSVVFVRVGNSGAKETALGWKVVERKIGKAGALKRRMAKQREWDRRFGEGMWMGASGRRVVHAQCGSWRVRAVGCARAVRGTTHPGGRMVRAGLEAEVAAVLPGKDSCGRDAQECPRFIVSGAPVLIYERGAFEP